jgi:hypothetical protein
LARQKAVLFYTEMSFLIPAQQALFRKDGLRSPSYGAVVIFDNLVVG